MGTHYKIKIYAASEPSAELVEELELILLTLDEELSTWREDSWVSDFNRTRTSEPIDVPDLTWRLLLESLDISEETNGKFDVTLGNYIEIWGHGAHAKASDFEEPTIEKREWAKAHSGYQKIKLNKENQTIKKLSTELKLEFSAIAKGYAVDLMAEKLRRRGVKVFLINFGGEVLAGDAPPNKTAWRVITAHGEVELSNSAVATSGSEHRHKHGRCHIIKPVSGVPCEISISYSVEAKSCARADALATAKCVSLN
jgi:thiamine biosynthesis lipoprotein